MSTAYHHRTISVSSPAFKTSDWGTPYFLFHSIKGQEAVNDLFEYTVICRSQDEYNGGIIDNYISKASAQAGGPPGSNLDLEATVGKYLTVAIELDGKIDAIQSIFGDDIERAAGGILPASLGRGTRYISGLISQASYIGTQGRHAMYQFTIRNWMHLLTESSDYKVWQKISIPDIIRSVLSLLPYQVEYRLTRDYPALDFQVQYGETHYHFIKRLMEEVGISYFVDHQNGGHTIVITDALNGFRPMDSAAYQTCYVYPPNLKLQEEYISHFEPLQQHVTGHIRLNDYQFKQPTADQTSLAQQPWDTAHNTLEVYEWQQGDYLSSDDGGHSKAQLYMEALRQHGHRALASGNLRGIQSGHSLLIANHPNEDSNRGWIVLGTTFEASETSQETNPVAKYSVQVQFELQPDNEQVRPDRLLHKPQAHSQTATVVGPEGQEVWVDQYGRIKIQFHWDRYGQNDENSSCWVRVSSPWQGTNFGGVHHPRIGQEVIIDFLNADADMPYVSGRLTNPDHMALWELPSQHALSGFKSKEIDGAQNNHLIMDDTPQQVQVQLTSDHQLSQLNLGYITRIPDVAGRADYRGQGFELRTDGWGVARGAKGMLLSTYSRATGSGHIKDLSEIIGVLKTAQNQHHSFTELAIDNKADERSIGETTQAELKQQNEEIAGHSGGDDKFPELQQPHLVLGSPAGLAMATPQSVHIASNGHTAITTGQDLSMSVGKRFAANVLKGISMFTQTLGIKWFAAKGKVEIQAQTDSVEMIAEKVLRLMSAQESIEVAGKTHVLLTAGGSYIRLDGSGIEEATDGSWKAWAADHDLPGPKSLPYKMPKFEGDFSNRLDVYDVFAGHPMQDIKYTAIFEDGRIKQGNLDEDGRTQRIFSKKKEKVKVLVGHDEWIAVVNEYTQGHKGEVTFEVKDILDEPVKDMKYHIVSASGSVLAEGKTSGSGKGSFNGNGEFVSIMVESEHSGDFKILHSMNSSTVKNFELISPKILKEMTLHEDGAAGEYRRGTYQAKAGDTLKSVAQKFGCSVLELIAHNIDLCADAEKTVLKEKDLVYVPPKEARES